MVDSYLHIIMSDAVYQQTLNVEQIVSSGQLQQTRELNTGITLSHLTNKTHQGNIC